MAEVTRDKDIREPLFEYLEEKYGKIRIIEEKMMGRSRADVVMVTEDALVGLEIKSDADFDRTSECRDLSKAIKEKEQAHYTEIIEELRRELDKFTHKDQNARWMGGGVNA